jgi:hypothetical protein
MKTDRECRTSSSAGFDMVGDVMGDVIDAVM